MKRYELMFTHLSPNKHEEGRWDIHEYENGCYVKYNDHLAAMKELTNEVRLLTDRLAQVVKERDVLKDRESQMGRQLAMASIELEDAHKERDEFKRWKSCEGCESFDSLGGYTDGADSHCIGCSRFEPRDNFKPRDPSAAQGGGE